MSIPVSAGPAGLGDRGLSRPHRLSWGMLCSLINLPEEDLKGGPGKGCSRAGTDAGDVLWAAAGGWGASWAATVWGSG